MTSIRKLEKVSAEEMETVDASKVTTLATEPAEVEGQDPYVGRVECAWCGYTARVILDTDYYKYFTCGNCGSNSRGRA